jgi:hypothetical protein
MIKLLENISYNKVLGLYEEAKNERSDWESKYRDISDYLLPGRGIYQTYNNPRRRDLTSRRTVNPMAEDALYVLTSGMHGALTSPSKPWFKLEWEDDSLNEIEALKSWLELCDHLLNKSLHNSNFYSIINSFYIEYSGFGTGCVFVGDGNEYSDFQFELLTAGEYCFSVGIDGHPDSFFRTILMSPKQICDKFGDNAPDAIKDKVSNRDTDTFTPDLTVLEYICKKKYMDKPYVQVYYLKEYSGKDYDTIDTKKPLAISGFYEFPYMIARWNTIGSDVYGIGPGFRVLSDIKRLQEMEKAFLLATHKTVNPPLNVPARLKGKVNSLPGAYNYSLNPNDKVTELYQVRFDFQGISMAIERVEQRIMKAFFNDVFFASSRDPNKTPYKAMEVQVREQEKMLRLGPVVERLQYEFLQPMIERCFNILLRNGKFPELSPDLQEMVGDYNIVLVSPLATAQRQVALQGINSFLTFIGQAAQIDQTILDNIDVDYASREYADITGVDIGILRPKDKVEQLRKERAQAMAIEKQKQDQMMQMQIQNQMQSDDANRQLVQSEAANNLVDTQQKAIETGLI